MKIDTTNPKFKPLPPYVFAKRHTQETTTYGGLIILPDEQNSLNRRCTITAIHGGRKTKSGIVPCAVKVGDQVEIIIFDHHAKVNNELDQELEICHEDDILCAIVPEDVDV